MQKVNFTTYNSKEELEKARALEASKASYTERFYILMRLIKISTMINNAKIIQSPKLPKA
jgi:hypothetical protein